MKNHLKTQIIALICLISIFVTSIPTHVFAADLETERQLREAIEGGAELVQVYPNGLINFIGTRFTVNEATGVMEVKLARQGGTTGQVSVDLKILDVSSEYMKDYIIETQGNFGNQVVLANPNAQPIINLLNENLEIKNSDELGMQANTNSIEAQAEIQRMLEANNQQPASTTAAALEPSVVSSSALQYASEQNTRVADGLRGAAQILTGREYNTPSWRELDIKPSEVEALKSSYMDFYDRIPGMETTIVFNEGEYDKSIYIKPINDNLSESEEQFIMVLSNPQGGVEIGEFYNSWVNIIDDEPLEKAMYEMTTDKVSVEAGAGAVTLTVKRTSGLHTNSSITVATSSLSAKADIDYIPESKRLLFLPGVTEQSFTVNLLTSFTDADKTFAVVIDDDNGNATSGKSETYVTITKSQSEEPIYSYSALAFEQMQPSIPVTTLAEYVPRNQSSSIERITQNGRRVSEDQYLVMPNDFTLRYNGGYGTGRPTNEGEYGILMDPWSAGSHEGVQAPVKLFGVKSLEFYWSNDGSGSRWYYHDDWWLFGWWCRSSCGWRYSYNFGSKFTINGPAKRPWNQWDYNQYAISKHGYFGGYVHKLNVDPWMWDSNSIEYWAWANANDVSRFHGNAVRLFLQNYNLTVSNDAKDTGVQARNVTGISASGEPIGTGAAVNVGELKIRSVARDTNVNTGIPDKYRKAVYRGDVITFEPTFYTDPQSGKSYSENAYLWGYKVLDRQGNWKFFEGTVMNLNNQWFKENAGTYETSPYGLFANALLKNNSSNWEIVVRPVFKAKNETFVKLDLDSSKGYIDGFLNGSNSRVFAISKFDTLSLKAVTVNSTVYDWYVQTENSNVVVNSLADATTYFNNVTVGSSGNLASTSSFTEKASKVTLTNSNVNPAAKTLLTYKPTGRFTSIMPSFNKNVITVQENPQKRTAFEAYDLKIFNPQNQDIRSRFLNDGVGMPFYNEEKAKNSTYKFEFKLRPTGTAVVPQKVALRLYKDQPDGAKAVFVETIVLTRNASSIYSFNLNPWLDKYTGCYATVGSEANAGQQGFWEQPIDFMLNSGFGAALYDDRNNMIVSGTQYAPLVYDNVTRNDVYTINGYTQSNFTVSWFNATGDLDKNGSISTWENSLFKDYRMIDRTPTIGDTYYLKATYDMPIVYYNLIAVNPNANKNTISGNISISNKTFLNQSTTSTTPVSGIQIYVNGESTLTDEKGNFSISSTKFEPGKKYSCVYTYQGYKYTGYMQVGRNNIIIDLFSNPDMELRYMKLYEIPQNGGEEQKPKAGSINVYEKIDRNFDLKFNIDSRRLVSTVVEKAKIVVRAADGSKVTQYGPFNKVKGTAGDFETQLNASQLSAGQKIYIVPIDNAGAEYPELATGILITKDPSKVEVKVGVDVKGIPAVSLFGQMMGNLSMLDTNAGKAKPMTDKDKANLNKLSGNPKARESDQNIDETERNLFTLSIGFDSDMKEVLDGGLETPKTAVNKEGPKLSFNVGLVFVYEIKSDGGIYFNQLAISAEVGVGMSITLTYITPIGIPVYASFSFSVSIGVEVGVVAKEDAPLLGESWKGKVSEDTTITIKIGVGVELGIGIAILKIYLAGTVEVLFKFTVIGDQAASASITFTAKLGIRFFFFSREWVIISKTWGISTRAMFGSNDLYTPVSGFEELPRDYLSNRSSWQELGMSTFARGRDGTNERAVIASGAYPYPENKLINLPNNEILWVFVDDVPSRTNRNRTAVFYSIIDANGNASAPRLLDDDGTLDEAPDVLDLGNGKIILSWSDASRVFTESDDEKTVLTHMDISVAFFDVATKTMSEPTAITKTTGRFVRNAQGQTIITGDFCGDTTPRAAYDPATDRIILYYMKSDYYDGLRLENVNLPDGSVDETGSIGDAEDMQLLVGDVVNAFSLIVYRYYENGAWNDETDYKASEVSEMQNTINNSISQGLLPTGYTVEDYKREWYGQRFLNLAESFNVIENTITTGGETVEEDGYFYTQPSNTTTVQTIEPLPSERTQKVVDTAISSYNGLALFAYSADRDQDLSDDSDAELYLQIYNFSENSFTHPIRLTVNQVKDSQPKFIRTNGITYLYWIQDGSLVFMDISNLVKFGLKKVNLGTSFAYVVDKGNENFVGGEENTHDPNMTGKNQSTGKWGEVLQAVVSDREAKDRAVTSFDLVSVEAGDVYLLWTEFITSLKDTEDKEKAADIDNQEREKQIFVARWQPENAIIRTQVDYINEFGQTAFTVPERPGETFQYIYSSGIGRYPDILRVTSAQSLTTTDMVINYNETPDINGFIGGAKANDPIIKQELVPTGKSGFSKPIQITTGLGANYDQLGVAATADGGLRLAFVKYIQELENGNFTQNTDNRALGLLSFSPSNSVELKPDNMNFSASAPKPGEEVSLQAIAKNTGLESIESPSMSFYQVCNGVETLIDTVHLTQTLVGGDEFKAEVLYTMPEYNGTISIKAELNYAQNKLSASKDFVFELVPEFEELRYEFTEVGKLVIDGKVTNIGNKNGDFMITIKERENILATIPMSLEIGESKHLIQAISLPNEAFIKDFSAEELQEEIQEIAAVTLEVGEIKAELPVVRSAPLSARNVIETVSSFTVAETQLSIAKGTSSSIHTGIDFQPDASEELKSQVVVRYLSSDPTVAQVDNSGTVYALSEGVAQIQVILMPSLTLSVATNSDTLAETLNSPSTLPSELIQLKTVNVSVYQTQAPIPTPEPPYTPSEPPYTPPVESAEPSATPEPSILPTPTPSPASLPSDIKTELSTSVNASGQRELKVSLTVEANTKDDKTVALVTNEMIDKALSVLASAAQAAGSKHVIELWIRSVDSNDIKVVIPPAALAKMQNVELRIVTELSTLVPDAKLLQMLSKENSKDLISFRVAKQKDGIDNRPTYEFNLYSGNKEIRNFSGGKIAISIPYTLRPGENPNAIVVYCVDSNGKQSLVRAYYDSDGTVEVKLSSFSKYLVIGYNEVSFADVPTTRWYFNPVSFIAARGITVGIDEDNFGPEGIVTRAQFITMLCRTYGIAPRFGDNFNDAGDDYYTGYIAAAKQLGISAGIGNDLFAPDKEITRQEMFTLFYNILKQLDELPSGTGKALDAFTDTSNVDDWAREAITYLTANGIIYGDNNKLLPKDISTRAQLAQVFYLLLTR